MLTTAWSRHGGATVLMLTLVGLGCGGDDDASFTDEDATKAVKTYTEAFANGDADKAWSMVSEDCQDEIGQGVYADTVESADELFPNMRAEDIDVDLNTTGLERAMISYHVTGLDEDYDRQRWIFETGEWHWNAC